MLNTLETLANKLSSVQQNNKGILLDNNGNKLNGLTAVISRSEKTQHQHHYQKESIYHRSSPNSNNNNNSSNKYTDMWVTCTSSTNWRRRKFLTLETNTLRDMMFLVIFRSTPIDMNIPKFVRWSCASATRACNKATSFRQRMCINAGCLNLPQLTCSILLKNFLRPRMIKKKRIRSINSTFSESNFGSLSYLRCRFLSVDLNVWFICCWLGKYIFVVMIARTVRSEKRFVGGIYAFWRRRKKKAAAIVRRICGCDWRIIRSPTWW